MLSNVVFGVLRLFCGVNVPINALPGWMSAISPWLPLTHTNQAARIADAGACWSDLAPLILRECALCVAYFAIGLALLGRFERVGRRFGTLGRALACLRRGAWWTTP